jgi:hypothetical protein
MVVRRKNKTKSKNDKRALAVEEKRGWKFCPDFDGGHKKSHKMCKPSPVAV